MLKMSHVSGTITKHLTCFISFSGPNASVVVSLNVPILWMKKTEA